MRVTTLLDARMYAQAEIALYYMAGRSIENAAHVVKRQNHRLTALNTAFQCVEGQFVRRERLIAAIDKRINGAVIVDLRKPLEDI